MDQHLVNKLTEIVLANLRNESFSVRELARMYGIAQSTLNRRLNNVIGKNINQFIREVRLQKAMEMLQYENLTAAEVSFRVGFKSPAYFNVCFKKHFGISPGTVKTHSLQPVCVDSENKNPVNVKREARGKRPLRQYLLRASWYILLILVLVLLYNIFFPVSVLKGFSEHDRKENGKLTVVITPFVNLTGDPGWSIWQTGIQDNLISILSDKDVDFRIIRPAEMSKELPVEAGSDDFKISALTARKLARSAGADILVFGSFQKSGNEVRINANIICPDNAEVFRSFRIHGMEYRMLHMADSLSNVMKDYLLLSLPVTGETRDYQDINISTHSPEAYKLLKGGERAVAVNDFPVAVRKFFQSAEADTSYVYPLLGLSWVYFKMGNYEEGKKWLERALGKESKMTNDEKIYSEILYSYYFETPYKAINHIRQLMSLTGPTPYTHYLMGNCYFILQQYKKAIPEYQRSLVICRNRNIRPLYAEIYYELITCYVKTGHLGKARRIVKKAGRDFPHNSYIINRQLLLALINKDGAAITEYKDLLISLLKEKSVSEADIATIFAEVFEEAGMPDEAEAYYQKALQLEPLMPEYINNLSFFLIDTDRGLNVGLRLIENVLAIHPDNYVSLDCRGWALFRQGRTEEALKMLEKSWSLKPVYNQRIFDHIERVRNAGSENDRGIL